jgi:hypothetical protein
MSQTFQRNSLDRLPTRGEVAAGLLCSVVLVLIGGSILTVLIMNSGRLHENPRAAMIAALVGVTLAGSGLLMTVRIVFTPARKPSRRAAHIASLVISLVAALAVVVKIATFIWK